MATYNELYGLWHESSLKNRVTVAVVVAAQTVQDEDPAMENHANRLIWAQQAFQNPASSGKTMFYVVLAANKDVSTEAILSASDANIQAAVDAAVNTFATEVIE